MVGVRGDDVSEPGPIRARREPARASAAPAAITRYQYAMALPSQGVQCAPQAAAKGIAYAGW